MGASAKNWLRWRTYHTRPIRSASLLASILSRMPRAQLDYEYRRLVAELTRRKREEELAGRGKPVLSTTEDRVKPVQPAAVVIQPAESGQKKAGENS